MSSPVVRMVLHHQDGSTSTLVPDGAVFAVLRSPAAADPPEPNPRAKAAVEAAETQTVAGMIESPGDAAGETPPVETPEERERHQAARDRAYAAFAAGGIDLRTPDRAAKAAAQEQALPLMSEALGRSVEAIRQEGCSTDDWFRVAGYVDDRNREAKRKGGDRDPKADTPMTAPGGGVAASAQTVGEPVEGAAA